MTTRPQDHHGDFQARADRPCGRAESAKTTGRGGVDEEAGAGPVGLLEFFQPGIPALEDEGLLVLLERRLAELGSLDHLMRCNEPVRGLSKGAGYGKTPYVWETEIAWKGTAALRRPSQPLSWRQDKRGRIVPDKRRLKRAHLNPANDPALAEFLRTEGWEIVSSGVTGLPVGRPPQPVRDEETLWQFVTDRLERDASFRWQLLELWAATIGYRVNALRHATSVGRSVRTSSAQSPTSRLPRR